MNKIPGRGEIAAEPLPQERLGEILALVRQHGRVVASELAARFSVSEDSIRRDLRELAARGLCRRVYGGALAPTPAFPPLSERHLQASARKQALAATARALVQPGQVLLIDAGSSNHALAAALPEHQDLTVVTNAPDIAQLLMPRAGIQVLLIGGRLDPRSGAATGAQALEQVQRMRVDLGFPGTCAIDSQTGLWSVDGEEAAFKRALIRASDACAVILTNDKLQSHARFQVATLAEIDHLVLEHDAPSAPRQAYVNAGLQLHLAAPAS